MNSATRIVQLANHHLGASVPKGVAPRARVIENVLLDHGYSNGTLLDPRTVISEVPSVFEMRRLSRVAAGVVLADARWAGTTQAVADFGGATSAAFDLAAMRLPVKPPKPASERRSLSKMASILGLFGLGQSQVRYQAWLDDAAAVFSEQARIARSNLLAEWKAARDVDQERSTVDLEGPGPGGYRGSEIRKDLKEREVAIAYNRTLGNLLESYADTNWTSVADHWTPGQVDRDPGARTASHAAAARLQTSLEQAWVVETAIDRRVQAYIEALDYDDRPRDAAQQHAFVARIEIDAGIVDQAQFGRFESNGPVQTSFELGG